MNARINAFTVAPDGYKAMIGLEQYLSRCGLEKMLLHLIKLAPRRLTAAPTASTCTGKICTGGETEQRMCGLDAWRESPYYTEHERAALEWTKALTLVTQGHVPDEIYESVRKQFSEKELADLSLAVATINAWNRLAISLRSVPGNYQPSKI